MELKLAKEAKEIEKMNVLIVPYGIEIVNSKLRKLPSCVLIVPYGIEIVFEYVQSKKEKF